MHVPVSLCTLQLSIIYVELFVSHTISTLLPTVFFTISFILVHLSNESMHAWMETGELESHGT